MERSSNIFQEHLEEALKSGEEIDLTLLIGDEVLEILGAYVKKLTTTTVTVKYPVGVFGGDDLMLDKTDTLQIEFRKKVVKISHIVGIEMLDSVLDLENVLQNEEKPEISPILENLS